MKAMVRSRSTVMRLVRDTPGRRVSFIHRLHAGHGAILAASGPEAQATSHECGAGSAWRACKTALGFWSNPEEMMQNRLRAAVLGLGSLGLGLLGLGLLGLGLLGLA